MKQPIDEDVELRAALNALGTLTLNEARAFAEDLAALDDENLREIAEFDAVANLLAFSASEIAPPVAVWDKLRAVMEAEPANKQTPDAPDSEITHQPLQQITESQLVTVRKDEGQYQQVCEGIFAKTLFQNSKAGTTTYLVKFDPGARTPKHRHPGMEECMVVEGDFQVDGKDLRAGDYHCALPGSIHERPYSINGATVLIVAEGHYEVLAN